MAKDLSKLTSADFRQLLNRRFLLRPEATAPVEVELIAVSELGEPDAGEKELERRRPFSIVFRSPRADTYLPQRMYLVEHEQLGSLRIFLVPIGPDRLGMRYEAVFA